MIYLKSVMKIKSIVLTVTLCHALLFSVMLGGYTSSISEIQGSISREYTAEAYYESGGRKNVGYVTAKGEFQYDGENVLQVTDNSFFTGTEPLDNTSWGNIIDGGKYGMVFAYAYYEVEVWELVDIDFQKILYKITTSAWVVVDANGYVDPDQSGIQNDWVRKGWGGTKGGSARVNRPPVATKD